MDKQTKILGLISLVGFMLVIFMLLLLGEFWFMFILVSWTFNGLLWGFITHD